MRPKFTREDLREIRSAARALRGERVLWGDGGSEDVILSTGPAEVHVFPDKRGKALTASVFRGRAANAERVTIDPVASGAKRPAGRKTATRRKVARKTPNPHGQSFAQEQALVDRRGAQGSDYSISFETGRWDDRDNPKTIHRWYYPSMKEATAAALRQQAAIGGYVAVDKNHREVAEVGPRGVRKIGSKVANPAKKKRAARPLREGQRVYHCAKRCR